jgi:protein farnesyltransferase/geranylgeranyltransferase type-1 subunit alpha
MVVIDEEVAGYFRAILASNEISTRAYQLTQEVLKYNPGDYNAWLLRRKIIDELKIPLEVEMEFLLHVGLLLEKNF